MKILIIHNFHRKGSASGDSQVFKNESNLLRQYGNEVIQYTVSNDEFDSAGIMKKIISAFGMLWSFKNYKAVQDLIKSENPDIVHIHTFFPLLSPSVLYAAKRCHIKVVATLHDMRLICPCATSLRGTKPCIQCKDGHYFRMCRYNCFKGSKWQSFFVACIFKYHRMRKSFYKQIDRYICLNESQISLLKEIGFDEAKITKKYNFVSDINLKLVETPDIPNRYVVFYGRIGEEKGIRILMKIWEQITDIPLVVMGTGPMEEEFKAWVKNKNNVFFLGYTQHDNCLVIVQHSEFVVFPSIWYEGCSMVQIEAESLGKALIATDFGFSSEAIEDGVNGYKIKIGDISGFVKQIKLLWNDPDKCIRLGKNARQDYENKYLPEMNYQQLIYIYQHT